ncbi:MAG: hypothetical protein B7Z60_09070 [Ferrovum sp. 37-45-19]|nr:MAG: hypothetical protein B7Z60_09070 [Ferrovum sp. 37-45-19]
MKTTNCKTVALKVFGAIVFFTLTFNQASAGIFSDDQQLADLKAVQSNLNKQVQDLLERVERLEAANQNLPDMVSQFDNMTQSLADIKGKIDELNNRLDQMTKRNQELYLDLDSRLKVLEGGNPQASMGALKNKPDGAILDSKASSNDKKEQPAEQVVASDKTEKQSKQNSNEQVTADNTDKSVQDNSKIKEAPVHHGPSYDSGLNAFNSGKYEQSVKLLKAFILANPDDEKIPNALFWIGLNDLVLKEYKEAVIVNKRVIKDYPKSNKVPDAMLNLSRAYKALGESSKAKAIEHQLESKFPDSEATAKLKKHQLKFLINLRGR